MSGADAVRLIDRVITRDATRLAVGQVLYTPWCDERGKVIDDGTVARLDDTTFRWTAADPCYRWIRMNAAGLHVEVEDVTDALGALALQGPRARAVLEAATGADWSGVGYFRRRAGAVSGIDVDVTRTGYTGDLGYELWVEAGQAPALWDALLAVGEAHGLRPCGIRAMDVARVEAGLVLIEVDYTSARTALTRRARVHAVRDRPRPAGQLREGPTSSAGVRSSASVTRARRGGGWPASSSTGTTSRRRSPGTDSPRPCRRR